MPIQDYHRGVRDLKIAAWSSENSWGTAYDILGIRNATLSWVVETDELRGDDVVLDRYTKLISVTVQIEQAAVDTEALDLILGGTLTQNAAYYDLMISEDDVVPFIGIAGRVVGSNAKDLHFLVPKAKLAGNLQLQAQVDTYMLPNAEFQGVNEGATNGMLRLRDFISATTLTIPLATAVD